MPASFTNDLAWMRRHMPRAQRAIAALPALTGVRLACSVHLEHKMLLLLEALLERGAKLFLTTCNPTTVRDDVVAYLQTCGAETTAAYGQTLAQSQQAIQRALDWQPTHLVEMGADLTVALHQHATTSHVRAAMECTGSGIARLQQIPLRYPVLNCDSVSIKEGLHNRFMVGLTTWQAFLERTRLSLHEKHVVVIGYGLVGRGVAEAARAFGGTVCIVERDRARALEAAYASWNVQELEQAISTADVIVTATGVNNVLGTAQFALLRDGAFILNVGHRSEEIDVIALRAHPHEQVLPFIEAFHLPQRTLYLFAGGSMANLTAGQGDSLNSFDLTLAVLTAGIGHLVTAAAPAPGIHLLPRAVWEPCLA
ncbi:MAG TPA: adenosylhomocysteinase [Blastocatellia bacterium]|nr:adenosylhomocysteinase [Blastocatellia bacterium]